MDLRQQQQRNVDGPQRANNAYGFKTVGVTVESINQQYSVQQ